jgi:hypothetical protein
MRIVKPGELPEPRDREASIPLKIRGFSSAVPGWFAWFGFEFEETRAGKVEHTPVPIAGYATIEGDRGDRVVPMVLLPRHGRDLVDPRDIRGFLMISGPHEPMKTARARANHESKSFFRWVSYTRRRKSTPRACDCNRHDGHVCQFAEPWRYRGSCSMADCQCECHCVARGCDELSDEEWAEHVIRYGMPPLLK